MFVRGALSPKMVSGPVEPKSKSLSNVPLKESDPTMGAFPAMVYLLLQMDHGDERRHTNPTTSDDLSDFGHFNCTPDSVIKLGPGKVKNPPFCCDEGVTSRTELPVPRFDYALQAACTPVRFSWSDRDAKVHTPRSPSLEGTGVQCTSCEVEGMNRGRNGRWSPERPLYFQWLAHLRAISPRSLPAYVASPMCRSARQRILKARRSPPRRLCFAGYQRATSFRLSWRPCGRRPRRSPRAS